MASRIALLLIPLALRSLCFPRTTPAQTTLTIWL